MIKLLAAAALTVQPSGPAATGPCLPKDQFVDVVGALLPYGVENAQTRCRQHAGSTPFLASAEGRVLLERLRREAAPLQASAGRALLTLAGMTVPRGASPDSMLEAMAPVMMQQVMPRFDAEGCRSIDDLANSLAPLPAINVGRMIAAVIELAPEEADKGPPICRT